MVYHRCGKCDYKTNRKFNLKIHFQRKHANENFELKEDDSSRKSTICEQIKSQPNPVTSVGRNQCNRCGYLFSLKSSLTKHYKKCKGFIINPLQCEICLKTFSTRQGKCSHKKNVKCIPSERIINSDDIRPVHEVLCGPVVEDSLTAEQVLIKKLRDEIQQLKNENDRLRRRMQGFKDTDKKKIAAEQGWKCNICCIELPFNYQIDHIIPISADGLNDMSNGQALCVRCHERKSCREKK